MSRSSPARPGRHHHRVPSWARGALMLVAALVVATTGGVAVTAVAVASPGVSVAWAAGAPPCAAPATRMPLGKQGESVLPRAAWLAAAHHAGAPSPRPLKATLCSTPASRRARGWVAAVAAVPVSLPGGATREPSSRGPPPA